MDLKRWRSFHPLAVACAVLALGIFVWLNLEASRDAYVGRTETGFRGGVRQGYPFTWWDAGNYTSWVSSKNTVALSLTPYGGFELSGLAADIAILAGVVLLAGALGQIVGRRIAGLKPDAALAARPRASLRPLSAALALFTAFGLLWLNLRVETYSQQHSGSAAPVYRQRMGWPLATYTAQDPFPALLKKAGVADSPRRALEWLQANPDAFYKTSHWNEINILFNLLFGVGLIAAAACCNEWRCSRTGAPARALEPKIVN